MAEGRILVIDDEPNIQDICYQTLAGAGYEVTVCPLGKKGLKAAGEKTFDLALIDLMMVDIDGLSLQREIREIDQTLATVVITGEPTIETAVQAVREGASDYVPKPFTPDQLLIVVDRCLREKRLREENRLLRQSLDSREGFESVVGNSAPIKDLLSLACRVAESESSIIIEGETGTGKELIARGIHNASPRSQGPFLPINCAALPEHLLESELFGHERGSFTGAHSRKLGLLEAANSGTVFLDEISSLGTDLQAKLLRVLQERQIRRVGGREQINVDIRVVSATNEDLADAVSRRAFRQDLYYRLNVITLRVPPLRERSEDIPMLAETFLEALESKHPRGVKGISAEAMDLMQDYRWPGNVRELQNVVERAYLLTDSKIVIPVDLPPHIRDVSPSGIVVDPDMGYSEAKETYLEPFEKEFLIQTLQSCAGNVTSAAQKAGLHRSSFQRLMRRHDIDSEKYR